MQISQLKLHMLPLFCGITAQEVAAFVEATGATCKEYGKGDRITRAYESNSSIGVLVEGKAQTLSENRFGEEAVGHALERGSLIGSASAILGDLCDGGNASVEARGPALVLWVPYRALITAGPRLARIHGIVMKNLLEAFCWKNVRMLEKIELLSQKTLRERLILYLLQQERLQGRERVKVPGRVQLAKELQCNRSALTREISLMETETVLAVEGDSMTLNKEAIG